MPTTQEAAEYLGISTGRIRQLISSGQLEATKGEQGWLIEQAALDARKAQAKTGRPRKGARADSTEQEPSAKKTPKKTDARTPKTTNADSDGDAVVPSDAVVSEASMVLDTVTCIEPHVPTGVPFVSFKDVRKVYRMGEIEVAAIDGITFDIEQGELVVVVGPSGAGKTTLLNILGGMDSPTSGTITLDGKTISSYSEKELTLYRRYDIGFVFQFYNLVQNLTALENVELASQICRDPLPAADVLRDVGLGHRLDNFPAQLSGGEQQRVAIARALAKNPKLLLCDEPTGALDYQTGKAILKLLQDTCRANGRTVVLITHNTAFTEIADRVVAIREGKVARIQMNDHPMSAEYLEW